jgi:hypothetical protein
VNSLWLDFDRFVDTHLQLIGLAKANSHQDRYLKLRGFNGLLSAAKMQRMLNIRGDHTATVVEGHTGVYKEDIIQLLQQKSQERKEKINKKWSGKSLKTERSPSHQKNIPTPLSLLKGSHASSKNLQRAKTEATPSVYEELKLPKLRLKQHRQESVYRSLNMLDLSCEQ